jgi:hypothetical protein
MKNVYLTIVLFLSANSITAQTIKVAEPEFSGNIVYVNESTGAGIKLEKQTASRTTKANGAAFVPVVGLFAGKATSKNVIQGSSSPVQIGKQPKISFIVKVSDNSIDPTTEIHIFKLNSEKETRTVELGTAKVGSAKAGGIKYLDFNGSKYGQSSYLIEVENIETGEYAITLSKTRNIFNMFGIK